MQVNRRREARARAFAAAQKGGSQMTPDIPATEALARIRDAPADRPFVVAQLGQSLDGRIALASGESRYINGEVALDHLHRLRASVDAVIVGAGTVFADNPRLDVRRAAGSNPARVVIDPRGRLDGDGAWRRDDGTRRILVTRADARPACDMETIALPHVDGAIAPHEIVAALHARGLRRLLIEGGARTVSGFIDAGCVDRLHVLVACMLIGSGKPSLELAPLRRLADARRPQTDIYRLGADDVLFDCALKG